jgi:hypothetical protein
MQTRLDGMASKKIHKTQGDESELCYPEPLSGLVLTFNTATTSHLLHGFKRLVQRRCLYAPCTGTFDLI